MSNKKSLSIEAKTYGEELSISISHIKFKFLGVLILISIVGILILSKMYGTHIMVLIIPIVIFHIIKSLFKQENREFLYELVFDDKEVFTNKKQIRVKYKGMFNKYVGHNHQIQVDQVHQLYVMKKLDLYGFVEEFYTMVELNNGDIIELIGGLNTKEEAFYLEQKIEAFIGIKDRPVKDAYEYLEEIEPSVNFDLTYPIDVHDDLTVIEGIGKKFQYLLKRKGVFTYSQLKDIPLFQLKKLLLRENPVFRLHDPDTWIKQARLADEEKWAELIKYQERLRGGRMDS